MHRGERVEEERIEELQAGLEELEADQHREETAEEEHDPGKDEIHRADVFVIGRVNPTTPAMRLPVVVFLVRVNIVRAGGGCVSHDREFSVSLRQALSQGPWRRPVSAGPRGLSTNW